MTSLNVLFPRVIKPVYTTNNLCLQVRTGRYGRRARKIKTFKTKDVVAVKTQVLNSFQISSVTFLPLPREARVSVTKNYTYDDGCEPCGTDVFSREPFVVMFSSKHAGTALAPRFLPRLWSRKCDL